jgi:hypothetical protein
MSSSRVNGKQHKENSEIIPDINLDENWSSDFFNSIKETIPTRIEDDDLEDIDSISWEDQATLRRFESDTDDRRWLARWTAWVVSIWLALVIITVIITLSERRNS